MNLVYRKIAFVLGVAALFGAGCGGCGGGGEPESGPHGGVIVAAGDYKMEVLCSNVGVEIYPHTREGDLLPVEGLKGTVLVTEAGGETDRQGFRQHGEALYGQFDFSGKQDGFGELSFEIVGLETDDGEPIRFSAPFVLGQIQGYTCPEHPDISFPYPTKCVKCGGKDLVLARMEYQCPNHPGITSMFPGSCEKCELSLVLRPIESK